MWDYFWGQEAISVGTALASGGMSLYGPMLSSGTMCLEFSLCTFPG